MPDFNINHQVNRVRQPDENSCWAACLKMKLESAGRRVYSVPGIKAVARQQGVTLKPNGSVAMNWANMTQLGQAFNIHIHQNAGNIQLSDLIPILRRSPIILFGAFNYAGRATPMHHAVLLHQVFGDGSKDTGLALVDPQQTKEGDDSSKDIVCSWETLGNEIIDSLDYVSALR